MSTTGQLLLLTLVVLFGAIRSQGVQHVDLYPHRFPATPLLQGEEAAALLRYRASADGMVFMEQPVFNSPRSSLQSEATHVIKTAEPNEDALVAAITRECPQSACKANQPCPFEGGVCCRTGSQGMCCPKGSTCLTTDPPTCVKDDPKDENRCAEASCAAGYHCPHKGIATCCLGGMLCCPHNTHCRATQPPSCERLLTPKERADYEKVEEELSKSQRKKPKALPRRGHGPVAPHEQVAAAKKAAQSNNREAEIKDEQRKKAENHVVKQKAQQDLAQVKTKQVSLEEQQRKAHHQRELEELKKREEGEKAQKVAADEARKKGKSVEEQEKAQEAAKKSEEENKANQKRVDEAAQKAEEGVKKAQEAQIKQEKANEERAKEQHKKKVEADERAAAARVAEQRAKEREQQEARTRDIAKWCNCQIINVNFNGNNYWQTCPGDSLLVGIHRQGNFWAGLWAIDQFHCCRPCGLAGQVLQVQACRTANWVASFDWAGWSWCPGNTYLNGLYKSSCPWLHCIEYGQCCAIRGSRGNRDCNTQQLWSRSFDNAGWSQAGTESGQNDNYWITGLYRSGGWQWNSRLFQIEHPQQCHVFSY